MRFSSLEPRTSSLATTHPRRSKACHLCPLTQMAASNSQSPEDVGMADAPEKPPATSEEREKLMEQKFASVLRQEKRTLRSFYDAQEKGAAKWLVNRGVQVVSASWFEWEVHVKVWAKLSATGLSPSPPVSIIPYILTDEQDRNRLSRPTSENFLGYTKSPAWLPRVLPTRLSCSPNSDLQSSERTACQPSSASRSVSP